MLQEFKGKAFHYTSLSSAFEIIKNGELWLTYIRSLNDASEWHYAIASIVEYLNANKSGPTAEYLRQTFMYVDNQEDLHSGSIDANYVFCLSRRHDDISQWRLYGDNAHGVCIEFDVKQLCQDDLSLRAYKMCYGLDSIKKDLLRFAQLKKCDSNEDQELFSEEQRLRINQMFDAAGLLYQSAFLKHPSYNSEQEVRVVFSRSFGHQTDEDGGTYFVPGNNSKQLQANFRVRGRDLVPFVKRSFSPQCIRRIFCCGKSGTMDNVKSLGHFLRLDAALQHIEIEVFDAHFR
jgi:hypothetical protein